MSESSQQQELHDVSAQTAQEPAPEQLEHLAQRLAAETELDQASVETAIAVAFRQTYQGPIPSPQIVQRLNEIQPDLGTRIVEDHLEQQKHDRFIDMEQVSLAHKGSIRADRALNSTVVCRYIVRSTLPARRLCGLPCFPRAS